MGAVRLLVEFHIGGASLSIADGVCGTLALFFTLCCCVL